MVVLSSLLLVFCWPFTGSAFAATYLEVNLAKNSDLKESHSSVDEIFQWRFLPPIQEDLTSLLPVWIIESLKVKAVKLIDSKQFNFPSGLAAVELVAGRESAIAQIIRTAPNKFYNLTSIIGDKKNGYLGYMIVEAFAAIDSLKVLIKSQGTGRFKTVSFKLKAILARTHILQYFLLHEG